MSPGIDSKESIPPANVAWRTVTITLHTRFLAPIDCLKIPAQVTQEVIAPSSTEKHMVGSLKMNTALEYSTRVVQEGDRRCKKSTVNDLAYLTPLRIPLMNPVIV
jgi:hypothetical protein